VGLELAGRYGDERGLFELAAAIGGAAGASRRRPPSAEPRWLRYLAELL
jgi:Asp-tRNA(Asn)/Glu-tRNA(Gln) amidotransferase A subunit family amidase